MPAATFSQQLELINQHRPSKQLGRRYLVRAAVAVILRQQGDTTEVLMMKRAERKGDPWSGHMAFPGGKKDRSDDTTFTTALRETAEETGMENVETLIPVGRMSDLLTRPHSGRRPMVVTPFVFHLRDDVEFAPNHEVAKLLWVSLDYLANAAHRETMSWTYKGVEIRMPCYYFQQQKIWGLSLTILDEMNALLFKQRFKDSLSRVQVRPPGIRLLSRLRSSR